ncbi:MAG TPA: GNAT family N-acetyltransferase [Caldilineaceae bacterium]|nr:GNAT family N-acetyltransferase [Caldilineaceae bacterium]
MTPTISLLPLSPEHHSAALQGLYQATPGYWALFQWSGAPLTQAEHDLRTAAETPGRTLMGIVRPLPAEEPGGAELIGLVDFRLHWPGQYVVYIGRVMVAERWQRQGIATQAWQLLATWLANQAGMHKARLAVEQFNPGALRFFTHLGFALTGQTDRYRVGDHFVRLLYMELNW